MRGEKFLADMFKDYVEVTRCKNCRWYGILELKKDGTVDRRYKPTYCFFHKTEMPADGFCSYACREVDEEE